MIHSAPSGSGVFFFIYIFVCWNSVCRSLCCSAATSLSFCGMLIKCVRSRLACRQRVKSVESNVKIWGVNNPLLNAATVQPGVWLLGLYEPLPNRKKKRRNEPPNDSSSWDVVSMRASLVLDWITTDVFLKINGLLISGWEQIVGLIHRRSSCDPPPRGACKSPHWTDSSVWSCIIPFRLPRLWAHVNSLVCTPSPLTQ